MYKNVLNSLKLVHDDENEDEKWWYRVKFEEIVCVSKKEAGSLVVMKNAIKDEKRLRFLFLFLHAPCFLEMRMKVMISTNSSAWSLY